MKPYDIDPKEVYKLHVKMQEAYEKQKDKIWETDSFLLFLCTDLADLIVKATQEALENRKLDIVDVYFAVETAIKRFIEILESPTARGIVLHRLIRKLKERGIRIL